MILCLVLDCLQSDFGNISPDVYEGRQCPGLPILSHMSPVGLDVSLEG